MGQLADVTTPFYIGKVIDLLREEEFEAIKTWCAIQAGVVLLAGVAVGVRAIVFNTLSERVSRKLRFDFYSSVIRQDLAFYDVRQTGKIMSNMNSDIQVIQDALGSNFSMQFRAAITVIVVVVIMLFISPALTGVTFAGVLVVLLVTKFFMGQMVAA